MALTPEEEKRLAELKRKVGSKALAEFGYSPNEAADISATDRALVKTFAADPEQQLKYIKKNYPDLDVVLNEGEVYAKKRGVNEPYKAMDPEFSPISSPRSTLRDIPQDIAESLYDITGGVGQGIATTAGAAMGAPMGPVGVAAGGAAASGASGAAIEGFRQMLGRALGVNEEFAPKQIGMAGAVGLAAPAVGAGIGKGIQAVGKGAKWLGKGMSKFTEQEAEQYLQNPAAVQEAVSLLEDKYNADIARDKASVVLNRLADTLSKYGKGIDKELTQLLEGKNVPLNIQKIRAMTEHLSDVPSYDAQSLKAEADALLDLAEKNYAQYVQRPIAQAAQAEMPGVMAEAAKKVEGSIIPGQPLAAAEEAAAQGELFSLGSLTKPQLEASLKAEQGSLFAPLKVAATEAPVLQEGVQPFVAREAEMVSPTVKMLGEEAQAALFEPGVVLKPGYEKNLSEVYTPAALARRLKQIFGQEAYSRKQPNFKGKTPATSEQLSSVVEAIATPINEIEGARGLNMLLQENIPLREEVRRAATTDPVSFLKSLSSKNVSAMAAAARKTGDRSAIDFAEQLGAARKIIGTTPSGVSKAEFIPAIGRKMMQAGQRAEKSTKAEKAISKSASLWQQVLNELNKKGETSL